PSANQLGIDKSHSRCAEAMMPPISTSIGLREDRDDDRATALRQALKVAKILMELCRRRRWQRLWEHGHGEFAKTLRVVRAAHDGHGSGQGLRQEDHGLGHAGEPERR